MKKLLLALALALAPLGAFAQTATPTAIVVASCGSTTPLFVVGRSAPVTVDVNGVACSSASGGGGGGTSSNFGSAFPAAGTAGGFSDGTNMQGARVFDADSGAGTQYLLGLEQRYQASGGSVVASVGSGAMDSGTQRFAIATDSPGVITTGTAGSASTQVLTVQGIASMTPFLTNPGTAANIGVGATGSAVPANAVYQGANTGGNLTGSIKCQNSVIYDASTNGSTQLVALSSGKVVYICGFHMIAGGSVNVKLIYGTGTACVTSPGNITPAYQLTAQAGLVDDPGVYQGLNAIASNELCINTSAGTAVQAIVYYTQF